MLWSCSHFFKILRNKNPHIAFDAPHPSLSSFDLWFPISCLRFPKRGRWNVFVFWFSDVEVIESRLRGKHNYCICLKASGLTTFSMHSESDSDQSWQKNPTRNRDAVLPQKATIQHYKIILFKLSCHVSSDCRLWTKLKESKYEIANSVTICWNRVLSKFRFFACFKPNVTLLEIKVGLTCCSISLLPLSWPFPVRNIVQWKCWCWCLHFR